MPISGVPAPIRSGLDLCLERDVAELNKSKLAERPTPLYKKPSALMEAYKPVRRAYSASDLGPSKAMLSKLDFQTNPLTTTTRSSALNISDQQMARVARESKLAASKLKTHSLQSDIFHAKYQDDLAKSRAKAHAR